MDLGFAFVEKKYEQLPRQRLVFSARVVTINYGGLNFY